MKRPILHGLGLAALATGGLLTVAGAAYADSGSTNGNQFTYIHQDPTTVCGNAVAVDGETVTDSCDGQAGTRTVDLDELNAIFDLALDFDGTEAGDDAGQWFHIESRTWS